MLNFLLVASFVLCLPQNNGNVVQNMAFSFSAQGLNQTEIKMKLLEGFTLHIARQESLVLPVPESQDPEDTGNKSLREIIRERVSKGTWPWKPSPSVEQKPATTEPIEEKSAQGQDVTTGHEDASGFAISINWLSEHDNPYTFYSSRMVAPPHPTEEWKTLFIWPGLQSRTASPNFLPIDNGVIQPVLTWGPSCSPDPTSLAGDDNAWQISAQYVNIQGSHPGYQGCQGGNRMIVKPDDVLKMDMNLVPDTTTWMQVVTNESTGEKVSFEIDMAGQAQTWAEFAMEIPGGWHENVPKWVVTDILIGTKAGSVPTCVPHIQTQDLPGSSVACAEPVIKDNMCVISSCSFNQ